MGALAEIAAFLLEHADLIGELSNAIKGGASKDDLKKAIRDSLVAASDAAMKAELGP